MKIELQEITIRDVIKNFRADQELGVFGMDGSLNIRPAYQREFIYKDKQRAAVITTIKRGFPLNVMYWAKNSDNTYEVIDGQQRTISICTYVCGDFAVDSVFFKNLTIEEQNQILDYKLQVYICTGKERDKLDWFETINISGEKLTEQELRNAVYTGAWLSDAKKYFSKNNCPAYELAEDYITGTPIRQDYLETAINWISNGNIREYMAEHQHDKNASELWMYFRRVIGWAQAAFPVYRREMKGINWGELYNRHRNDKLNPTDNEEKIKSLMMDDDVTKKRGVYRYILSGEEKYLSIRAFSKSMKREVFERQNGVCNSCGDVFEIGQMEADHIIPWSMGGKTVIENCQMLCVKCNREKSNR